MLLFKLKNKNTVYMKDVVI